MKNLVSLCCHLLQFLSVTHIFLAGSLNGVTSQSGSLCNIPFSDTFVDNVPENLPINSTLKHLNVYGKETEISIKTVNGDSHVKFDPISRNLTLISTLDTEQYDILNIKLLCTIKATFQSVEIDIKVILIDANDNEPIFERDVYTTTINELAAVGTTIIRDIKATDADSQNWYIQYEIKPGPFSDYFSIPIPAKGEIILKKHLDYETFHEINVTVKAVDNHPNVLDVIQPHLSTTAMIIVKVIDADDRNPIFLSSLYSSLIVETAPVGMELQLNEKIHAEDQDYGISTPIRYSIESDDYGEFFDINAQTGVVQIAKKGLVKGMDMTLLLKATQIDNADRYATGLLRVRVIAANENPPRFQKPIYVKNVLENTPVNTIVLEVYALDSDEGTQLFYSFGNNIEHNNFVIDSLSGEISTTQKLDYEKTTSYEFKVIASDGKNVDEATVEINVLDVNDNQPQFVKKSYTFVSNGTLNALVGKVTAEDIDSKNIISYKIDSEEFYCNNVGEIYISNNPEISLQRKYTIEVQAFDNGDPPLSSSTLVFVEFGVPDVMESTPKSDENIILISILGCICGALLVVVIILLVYIYRNKSDSSVLAKRIKFARTLMLLDFGEDSTNLTSSKPDSLKSRFPIQPHTLERHFHGKNNILSVDESSTHTNSTDYASLRNKRCTYSAHNAALFGSSDTDQTLAQENPLYPNDHQFDINRNIRNKPNSFLSSNSGSIQSCEQFQRQMRPEYEIEYNSRIMFSEVPESVDTDSFDDSFLTSNENLTSQQHIAQSSAFDLPRRKSYVSFLDDVGKPMHPGNENLAFNSSNLSLDETKPGITIYY